jgi:hypothetical protein
MPGINVILKGTTCGTVTDQEGKYAILLPDTMRAAILSFSFIGFVPQEVEVGPSSHLNITMQEDIKVLQSVGLDDIPHGIVFSASAIISASYSNMTMQIDDPAPMVMTQIIPSPGITLSARHYTRHAHHPSILSINLEARYLSGTFQQTKDTGQELISVSATERSVFIPLTLTCAFDFGNIVARRPLLFPYPYWMSKYSGYATAGMLMALNLGNSLAVETSPSDSSNAAPTLTTYDYKESALGLSGGIGLLRRFQKMDIFAELKGDFLPKITNSPSIQVGQAVYSLSIGVSF